MKKLSKYVRFLLFSFCALPLFSGCFTGIESTKKIKLTNHDKKILQPTDEELFFNGLEGMPLSSWDEGHKFYVTDDKALLVFDPSAIIPGTPTPKLGGDTIIFTGVESRIDAAGNIILVVNFTDNNIKLPYVSGKLFNEGLDNLKSDQIPMIIDLNQVDKARELLKDKTLWTRTLLWYDSLGNRIDGKKFIPVTVADISPGNMVFPLKVKIKDKEDNKEAWLYMNLGHSGNESRSFSRLFFLNDPRKQFGNISEQNWNLICRGEIALGMTKEECKLSLGNPIEINSGHDYSQTLDIWNYENGIVIWFEDGLVTRFRK